MVEQDKGILYAILSVMPSIGSVWGLVFYAVFSYLITFCVVGGIHYWANRNIDVGKILKQRVAEERRKLEQREQKVRQVYEQTNRKADQTLKPQAHTQ